MNQYNNDNFSVKICPFCMSDVNVYATVCPHCGAIHRKKYSNFDLLVQRLVALTIGLGFGAWFFMPEGSWWAILVSVLFIGVTFSPFTEKDLEWIWERRNR